MWPTCSSLQSFSVRLALFPHCHRPQRRYTRRTQHSQHPHPGSNLHPLRVLVAAPYVLCKPDPPSDRRAGWRRDFAPRSLQQSLSSNNAAPNKPVEEGKEAEKTANSFLWWGANLHSDLSVLLSSLLCSVVHWFLFHCVSSPLLRRQAVCRTVSILLCTHVL